MSSSHVYMAFCSVLIVASSLGHTSIIYIKNQGVNCTWEKVSIAIFCSLQHGECPVCFSGTLKRVLRQETKAFSVNIEIDKLEKENGCTTKVINKFISPRSP